MLLVCKKGKQTVGFKGAGNAVANNGLITQTSARMNINYQCRDAFRPSDRPIKKRYSLGASLLYHQGHLIAGIVVDEFVC